MSLIGFTVKSNDIFGRYGVTSKDLSAGDVILEEDAFVIGPKNNSPIVCLECFVPVFCTETKNRCSNCGWPLCEKCKERLKLRYHQGECDIFSEHRIKFYPLPEPEDICHQMDCITPLRFLLMKDIKPDTWDRDIVPMEDHRDARQKLPTWDIDNVNIVQYLRKHCKLADRYSDELIQRVCGILEVNAFEGKTAKGNPFRGVYPNIAILAHSCVPNTSHTVYPSESFRLKLRTTTNIKSGEMLYVTYTYTLWETKRRQEHLQQGKFFSCACDRCLDPTELNTNYSSLLCDDCRQSYISEIKRPSGESVWRCSVCENEISNEIPTEKLKRIQAEFEKAEKLPNQLERVCTYERLLNKFKDTLHPNHYIMIDIQQMLIYAYGHLEKLEYDNLSTHIIEHKVNMCTNILNILDKFEPGATRFRALILYELYMPELLLAKRSFDSRHISQEEYVKCVNRVIDNLKTCDMILQDEDTKSMEGRVLKNVKHNIKTLIEYKNTFI